MYLTNTTGIESMQVDTTNGTINATTSGVLFADDSPLECTNTPMFHLAFLGLLVAYLTPPSDYSSLLQHLLLSIAHLLWVIWLGQCSTMNSMFVWSIVLFVVNVGQTFYQAYLKRYHLLDPVLLDAYNTIFKPIKVTRLEFKKLCRIGKILELQTGECYSLEGVTSTDKLALLLEGKISVYCNNHVLHSIGPNQFLDSPEWESSPSVLPSVGSAATFKHEYDQLTSRTRVGPVPDARSSIQYKATLGTNSTNIPTTSAVVPENHFNVSLIATAPSQYIIWDRRDLELYLLHNKDMANLFKLILARDITDKLYAMNEKMTNEKGSQFDIRLPVIVSSLSRQMTTITTNATSSSTRARANATGGSPSLLVTQPSVPNHQLGGEHQQAETTFSRNYH